MFVSFNATFEGVFKQAPEANDLYKRWDNFIASHAGGTGYHHSTKLWVNKSMQDAIVTAIRAICSSSLAMTFVILCFATYNWYLSMLGAFNVGCNFVYFIGLWPLLGWKLDHFNAIYLVIAVGLSADHTVHLLYTYSESLAETRERRVREAIASMGGTAFNGALTMLLASAPLFLSQIAFFHRFAGSMCIILFLAISTVFSFLVPVLLLIGPVADFGDIHCFVCCSKGVRKLAPT